MTRRASWLVAVLLSKQRLKFVLMVLLQAVFPGVVLGGRLGMVSR